MGTLADIPATQLLDTLEQACVRPKDALRQALQALRKAPADPAWHERVVAEFELAVDQRLALFRTMTRIGPCWG